jgi:hypothetical protein
MNVNEATASDTAQRVINIHDLPCGNCGCRFGDHGSYRKDYPCADGKTVFCHAETPPIDPDPTNDYIGHLYRDFCGGHLVRIARKVTFITPPDGIDFELEVVEANPNAHEWCAPKRKLVSGRAISRTFHHSRKCPCGGGYER